MTIETMERLKALKLHGMAQAWPELIAQARHADVDPDRFMADLLAAERADREVRSVSYQMKAARFPAHRDLAGFDFAQARVDENLIRRLHTIEFLSSAQNVVLIGGPGTGKTQLMWRARPKNHYWPVPSVSRPSSATESACASLRPWNS